MLKVLGSNSKGNCYLLSTSKETLIIECGIKYKDILAGLDYDLSKVVGCLVTHEHKDHSKSIADLIGDGIDIYASAGTIENSLREEEINPYRVKKVNNKPFNPGTFTILPFDVHHDAEEPLGFLIHHKEIGNLLFLTDTYYCDYNFKNLNHILVECNYSKEYIEDETLSLRNRIVNSHFELSNVINFLKSNDLGKVRNIMLLHLSSINASESHFKDEVEKNIGLPITIAKKGIEIDLNI